MAPSTFVLDEHEEEHLQPATDSPGPAPIASATPRPLHIVQLVQQTSPTLQPCDPVQLISAAVVQHGEAHEGHAFPGAPTSLAEAVQQAQENQQHIAEAEQLLQDLLQRSCMLAQSQRRLEQQSVLAAISSSGHLLGCDGGRPVAALLIHRCLLHWRVLDAGPEASALLEGLMGAMTAQGAEEDPQPGHDSKDGQGMQQQQQYALLGPGMQRLAYWLASSSTLLALLTKQAPRISAAAAAAAAASAGASLSSSDPAAHAPTTLDRFSEMQRKLSSSIKAGWAQGLLAKIGKPKAAAAQPLALQEAGESMSDVMDSLEHSLRTGVHQAEEVGGSQTSASGHTIHTPGQHRAETPAHAGGETPSGARSLAGARATWQGAGGAGTAAGIAAGAAAVETFRQQLAGLTLRQYGLLRDAFKRQLAALLPACVQRNAVTLSPTSSDRLSSGGSWDAALLQTHSQASALGLGAASALRPWADLVLLLSAGLVMLQERAVPRIIIKCLMKQLLAFIDVQMFNQLLLRPECCAASNAAFMAEGLGHLDAWLASQAGSRDTTYLVALQADLRHTRQAVQFLVYPNKGALSLQDITRACKSLSLQQLYRLCTTFWDDLPPPLQPPPCSALKQQQHPGAGQQEVDGMVAVEGHGDMTGGREAEPSDTEQQQRQLRDGEHGDAAVVPLEAHSDPLTSTTHDAAPHEPPVHTHKSAAPLGAQAVDRATSGAGEAAAAIPRRSTSVSSSGFLDHSLGAGLGGGMGAGVGAGGMVSGEVLEELKSHSQVSSNGGLIVTFLLDEDQQPLIGARHGSAQGPGGVAPCAVAYEVLYLINDMLEPPGSIAAAKAAKAAEEGHECGGLYKRLKVPAHLLNDATPHEPFLFLENDVDV